MSLLKSNMNQKHMLMIPLCQPNKLFKCIILHSHQRREEEKNDGLYTKLSLRLFITHSKKKKSSIYPECFQEDETSKIHQSFIDAELDVLGFLLHDGQHEEVDNSKFVLKDTPIQEREEEEEDEEEEESDKESEGYEISEEIDEQCDRRADAIF